MGQMKILTAPDGRKIGWKRLAPGDFIELMDAVATGSGGTRGSLGLGAVVASVREIDDVPEPFPRSKEELRGLADRLGWDVISALSREMESEGNPQTLKEAAKN